MDGTLLLFKSMEAVLLASEVTVSSLIIFAAVGTVAYSISITIDHPTDPILLKFANPRRYFLSNGFLFFAIINFLGVLIIFTSVLLECCMFERISFIIPFLLLLSGVWLITGVSLRDLLWRIGR